MQRDDPAAYQQVANAHMAQDLDMKVSSLYNSLWTDTFISAMHLYTPHVHSDDDEDGGDVALDEKEEAESVPMSGDDEESDIKRLSKHSLTSRELGVALLTEVIVRRNIQEEVVL